MQLVIVESPTKARTLKKFLSNDYVIEASMGHIRDLPKSSMGVDVKQGFEPDYEVSKGKTQVISSLKKAAAQADVVYLATDPDREGEAISWHIKYLLQQNGKKKSPKITDDKFKRVTFHEITKKAIEEALTKPGNIAMDLVDAQQARRVVDRLVGYTLSPVLWKKVRRGLSAGRVQSVAVRLIVEREREIKAFIPVEYWNVWVDLTKDSGEGFRASLIDVKNLDSSEKITPIVEALKSSQYVVDSVERKEQSKKPNPPFTTSTLQQAAANVLGWSGKQTMAVSQQLYEAGMITYHRTDSVNLAAEAIEAARSEIAKLYGVEFVPEKPNYYHTKSKNAQEAHEAIRPTKCEIAEASSDPRAQKLYQLIWRRFMACQMKAVVYDQTAILIKAGLYKLRASGSTVKFEGWKKAYQSQDAGVILPEVKDNEKLNLKEVIPEQKFTQPQARYNDASLIKELEKRGIGRPSTYASIMSTIVDRGYVERIEKRYSPTSVGEVVSDFLVKNFATVMDYQFTADMEEDLDRIARGEKDWKMVMKLFWQSFEKAVKLVDKNAGRVEIPVEKTGAVCPKCSIGELVVRTGKFGKFMSCSRFPECDYKASLKQTVEGVVCPLCQSEIVQKRTRTGKTFWGCSNYPKCKWASWQDPRKEIINKK